MLKKLAAATFAIFALVAVAGAAGNTCQGTKIKLAGKKTGCRVKLDGTQASSGKPKDSAKDILCGQKFSDGFMTAESKPPCLTTGDEGAIEGKIDAFEMSIGDMLSPGAPPAKSKCQGAKIKAAANRASCLLRVKAKTAASGLASDDAGKISKCDTKFTTAFSKADAGADCTTHADLDAVKGQIDTFVDDVDRALDVCAPLVPGQPIANTYNIQDVTGPSVCIFGTAANQLQPCQSDADCGGTGGGCVATPWISAGGVVLPFPLGISATFTVTAADQRPSCSHPVCIACGNPNATCPGMTGCGANPNCVSATPTCCDQPAFTVPTFFLSGLNVCVKVDQKACGVGVVNTSNPQTGDAEVIKMGDTSDPGPDCTYGPGDPAAKPCGTLAGGAGRDKAGKVVRTLGNGMPDSSGIHSRFTVPLLATAWVDRPPPGGQTCPSNATFDSGETLMAQLILNAELSTAGATGALVDMNSDMCAVAGVGFGGDASTKAGPITLGPPALSPAPYGGGNNLMGSAGLVFPGSGPLYDIGFLALVPFGQPTVVASQSCTCTLTPGCPE